jgi:plastocyanin
MSVSKILAVVIVAAALTACEKKEVVSPDDGVVVSMPGFSYVPFNTTIKVGGVVVFDFPAESHNVIFARITGAPEDIQETVNKKVSRQFDVAGTFPYDCTIHPGMSGTVTVTTN